MLDYGSEDIDGMDDNAGEEQAQKPPLIGRWTATSSYDVYMVGTPKENNDDDEKDPVEDKPPEIQPKRQRQRRPSKPRREKIAVSARETTILRTMPKTKKTPSSQLPSRTTGRMGKLALMNRL